MSTSLPEPLPQPLPGLESQASLPPTPVYLRVLLQEIEYSGSSSGLFWQCFWASWPHLTDADLERLALAVGTRGRAQFRAITRFATLAQEISSTRTTAPINSRSDGRTDVTVCC